MGSISTIKHKLMLYEKILNYYFAWARVIKINKKFLTFAPLKFYTGSVA